MRRKDYNKKSYNNPQFPRKDKVKGGGGGRTIFLPLIFLILIISSLVFLGQSEFLQIKEVEVIGISHEVNRGIEKLARDQFDNKKLFIFSQINILLFDKKELKQSITDNYFFENVKIKKRLFNKLQIIVDQKVSGIIWSVNEQQYYLDLDGIVIRQLDTSDFNVQKFSDGTEIIRAESTTGDYPLIYDQKNNEVTINKPATSDQMVKFVVLLTQVLKAESDFIISYYYTDRPFFSEITMVTKEGWEAKFKVNDNPFKQVELLNSVLGQKIKDRENLQYIDLRFGEKIFYQ